MLVRFCAVFALVAACGAAPKNRTTGAFTGFLGQWQWTHQSSEGTVVISEEENWDLREKEGSLTGTYTRTVNFKRSDGLPFACNQHSSFQLVSAYSVTGKRQGQEVILQENSFQTREHPCDDGKRTLAKYTVATSGDRLTLRWRGGTQTLKRKRAPAQETPLLQISKLSKSYVWAAESDQAVSEKRSVSEEWTLNQSRNGELSGRVIRRIKKQKTDGTNFECNGDQEVEYEDRYQLVGKLDGTDVTLYEVSYDSHSGPCQIHGARTLGGAEGTLVGQHLVLRWRGNKRQVLRPSR